MSTDKKICSNCNQVIISGERRFTFTCKLPKREFSAIDALRGFLMFGRSSVELTEKTEFVGENRLLCVDCGNNLGTSYSYFQNFTNRTENQSYIRSKLEKPPDQSPKKRLKVTHIRQLTPVKQKMQKYVGSKRDFATFRNSIEILVRKEMICLSKYTSFQPDQITRENWLPSNTKIKSEIMKHAPLLHKILQGLTCRTSKQLFNNQMRTIIGIALQSRNRMINLFQKSVGLSLFIGKASTQTYDNFRQLGLSVSYKTVLRTLDILCIDYDKILKQFQQERTDQLEKIFRDKHAQGPSERPSSSGARRRIHFVEDDDEFKYYGGFFTTDNINHVIQPHRVSSKHQAKALNMTSNAFVFNRIPQSIADIFEPKLFAKAVNVLMSAYLPTHSDISLIKNDHLVIIKRLLVRFVVPFKSLRNHPSVNWYIPHKYSDKSAKKSQIVSLGILDVNQTSTAGTKDIMKYLTSYFPTVNGKVFQQVVAGDVLSVKMIVNAKHHLCNSDPSDFNLSGPVPAVGQFHLRMHLLKDLCTLFFHKGKGAPGRGTAPFLMTYFKHPQKLKDPQHNFLLTARFFKFCLAAHVVALATDLLDLQNDESSKQLTESSEDEKISQLEDLAERINDFEWHDIYKITAQEKFCYCDTEYDQTKLYIACGNDFCKHQLWYHVECLRNQTQPGILFNLPPANSRLKKDKYYCTAQCESTFKDKKLLYSKALINAVLNFEGYRDSIRTNDANRMDAYNKLHLIEFNNYKHPVYFKYCHLWQTRKHGWSSPSVQFDLMYNSTVNITGGRNSNLESDLFHEMLNRYLKDILLISHGGMTPGSIQRRSRSFQIINQLRADYTKLLNDFEDESEVHYAVGEKWKVDLEAAAKVLLEENLFKDCGERSHPGFKNFRYDLFYIDNIAAYKDRINQASKIEDDVDVYRKEKRMS